ncbi:MAG: hypothetical protein M0Z77_10350 [Thermoplasmatales archaeon]|nr:hypothetical protein [Thermoplasmatales archaeon]
MSRNFVQRQTTLVWKDGLKVLGQIDMEEVFDRLRMEGKGNGQ